MRDLFVLGLTEEYSWFDAPLLIAKQARESGGNELAGIRRLHCVNQPVRFCPDMS